jgi:hypothetical protein
VNLEELLYGCIETDSEWRRAETLGSAHLYYQVATSEVPLVCFEWPGLAGPIYGSLYLVTFGLHKTFVVMRSRVGPNAAVAAFRGLSDHEILPVCVSALLGHGEEWFGHELFDEPPTRLVNCRPDLLPKDALLEGLRGWAERVLGETEPALAEAYFESAYAEEVLPAPAPKAG